MVRVHKVYMHTLEGTVSRASFPLPHLRYDVDYLTLSLPHAELLKPEFFGRLTTYPVTCKLQHAGLFVTYAGPRSAYWESR